MAEITPVTREEFYLAKAGGQDVPVPSAVTREEHYLEKLSNDSVVVPSPVTRREKFLYFACGGEIDLPSEEKMTRLERLIAKAGGMDVATPTAVTRLEKFWSNVEGGGWKIAELTGTLPMTFRSNGTALVNYRIYGTADGAGVQTENVVDISASALIQVNAQGAMRYGVIVPDIPAGEWTISMNTPLRYPYYLVKRVGSVYTYISSTSGVFVPQTITLDEQCDLIIRTASSIETTWEDYFGVNPVNMMVTKGSTPPRTYIPYGYKLPLTVTSSIETKTTDIYIGDSKLGAEEYADYESGKIVRDGTPQDPPLPLPAIETFSGENTLDSTETVGEVTIKGIIKEAE